MKILCNTPWQNTWVSYWTKYIESRGHEVQWHIGKNLKGIEEKVDWCDAILSMWADLHVMELSKKNQKPLYVILRSYEIFSQPVVNDIPLLSQIKWENVKQLFMLNEAHYPVFKQLVKGVTPIFIKNGIDLTEWMPNGTLKDRAQLAWIADINGKKGVELLVQAVHELNKINPDIHIEHIGRNQDIRRCYYLNTVMPKLNATWFNSDYNNDHGFVRNFLSDKKFIISTSIAEGSPMNLIEAMAMGTIPLVHTWPGAKLQFPKECLWTTFDELRDIYTKLDADKEASKRMRSFAEEHYDYIKNYKPVIDAIEGGA